MRQAQNHHLFEHQYKKEWAAWLLLILPILCIYSRVFTDGYLVFDDSIYLTANPFLNHGLSFETWRWAFTTNYAHFWGPVTWISAK